MSAITCEGAIELLTEGARHALLQLAELTGLRKGAHVAEAIFALSLPDARPENLRGMHVEDLEYRAHGLFAAVAQLQHVGPGTLGVSADDHKAAIAVLLLECQRTADCAVALRAAGLSRSEGLWRAGHWDFDPPDTLR